MKTFLFSVLLAAFCAGAAVPQTFQFAAISRSPDGSNVVSLGTFLLSGESLGYLIDYDAPGFAAIREQDTSGSNATIFLVLEGGGCESDGGCGWAGSAMLSAEQAMKLKAGLLHLEVNGNFSGKLSLVCASEYHAQNSIVFPISLDGDNPTNRWPRIIRWGRGALGLTNNELSYEFRLPSTYGPFTADIIRPGTRGLQRTIANLGFLSCEESQTLIPPSDATGLEVLSPCVAQGSLCLDAFWIPQLLNGSLVIAIRAAPGWSFRAQIVPADTDRDGVPDYLDECPNTLPNGVVNADGCSIEQLCPCVGPWRNHGEYVNCLKSVANQFLRDGVVTEAQRRAIVNRGSTSDCGKSNR